MIRPAVTQPLLIHVELGAIWLSRGGDHLYIEAHEVPEAVRSLVALADALGDAE